jgi:hypothetical protein
MSESRRSLSFEAKSLSPRSECTRRKMIILLFVHNSFATLQTDLTATVRVNIRNFLNAPTTGDTLGAKVYCTVLVNASWFSSSSCADSFSYDTPGNITQITGTLAVDGTDPTALTLLVPTNVSLLPPEPTMSFGSISATCFVDNPRQTCANAMNATTVSLGPVSLPYSLAMPSPTVTMWANDAKPPFASSFGVQLNYTVNFSYVSVTFVVAARFVRRCTRCRQLVAKN